MTEWSASPVYICCAERGWSVSAAAPASTSRGPSSRHAREPFSTPRRIFTVTGTPTAAATSATTLQASAAILHQVRAGAGLRDLAHRAAEVHVDDVRAGRLDHPCRVGHRPRLGAEDLDREGVLVTRDAQVAEGALVAVLDAGRRDHLRADEAGAEPSSLSPKSLDADAGHRRKHDSRRHLDPADRPRLQEVYPHSAMVSMGN